MMGRATTGASFTGVIASMKVLQTVPPCPSFAVSCRVIWPLKSAGGVPENVHVAGSKVSQLGSAELSPSDAARLSVLPSASLKVSVGTVKLQAASLGEA